MATPVFYKIQFFTQQKRVLSIEWGCMWKIWVHNMVDNENISKYRYIDIWILRIQNMNFGSAHLELG